MNGSLLELKRKKLSSELDAESSAPNEKKAKINDDSKNSTP